MNKERNTDDARLEALYMAVGEADADELVSESLLRERREEVAWEDQALE